ncbi:MAG: hypothetical protein QM767_30375 [Anaeromyxobacter sp.]
MLPQLFGAGVLGNVGRSAGIYVLESDLARAAEVVGEMLEAPTAEQLAAEATGEAPEAAAPLALAQSPAERLAAARRRPTWQVVLAFLALAAVFSPLSCGLRLF